jgi:hypothetical protein
MRKITMLFSAAAGMLLLGGAATKAEACLICTSAQWCESGSGGSSCEVYMHEGRRWCQFSLECSTAVAMTPLEMSVGGTFLAANTVKTEPDGRAVSECNGFITRYSAASPEVQALRI